MKCIKKWCDVLKRKFTSYLVYLLIKSFSGSKNQIVGARTFDCLKSQKHQKIYCSKKAAKMNKQYLNKGRIDCFNHISQSHCWVFVFQMMGWLPGLYGSTIFCPIQVCPIKFALCKFAHLTSLPTHQVCLTSMHVCGDGAHAALQGWVSACACAGWVRLGKQ